ncbi:MAG: double-strand break repair protein AddB [Rhodospirillales bacterium]
MTGPTTVLTIPAGTPFVDALASGVLETAGAEPERLAKVRVLLPTRRACRSLREAFLRKSEGRPLLLPAMTPLGDVDEDELALSGDFETGPGNGFFSLPPAISGLRRQLLLTRLILARPDSETTPDQALRLAMELARLLDQVHTERLDFGNLEKLAPQAYADHWGTTLKFLRIVTDNWPGVLKAEGCVDRAEHRNLLLDAQAEAWRRKPPETPVIAAGSTGSIPATADLLKVIAGLPQGSVVLPGLDNEMDDQAWRAIEPSHPQYGMARLLEHIGVERSDVAEWPHPDGAAANRGRARLINLAFKPAAVTGNPEKKPDIGGPSGISRIDCPGPREEAGTIALIMRHTLENKGKTCALVTPDRTLARRVASELGRWGLAVDDSAGRPLAQTPPCVFLRLTARMVAEDFAPVALLAALKHPLAGGGQATAVFRSQVRLLEIAALRGPRPAKGINGLRHALAQEELDNLKCLLETLEDAARSFHKAINMENASLRDLLRSHVEMAQSLAATNQESGANRLWRDQDGEAAAALIAEINESSEDIPLTSGKHYPAMIDTLMVGRVVRPRYGLHPRLHIWGLLEARLQHSDVLILGGLNEDTWPPEARSSPWMSRPMLKAFGLPPPERRIGLTAHDFAQAFSAPEVFLTRSTRVDGTPTVPSRWLQRLDNLLKGWGLEDSLKPDGGWLDWSELLDATNDFRPVPPPAPKPPVSARPRKLSVTNIETWIRDPYAIYARYVLNLRVLDPIDADAGAAERGSIIHDILDRFVKAHPKEIGDDAHDVLLEIGKEMFDEHLSRPGVRAFWWPRFLRIANWFVAYERQRRNAGCLPAATEIGGEWVLKGPGGPFRLTARADRIDRLPEGGLAVIDYKTGQLPTAPQVASGLVPQLSLEAAMIEAGAFEGLAADTVEQLIFVRLSGGRDPGQERVLDLELAEVVKQAKSGLEKRIADFDRKDTPYRSRPRPMFESRYGDYDHLARVKEWLVGGKTGQ